MNLIEARRPYSSTRAPNRRPIVYVVDDDDAVRGSLECLIRRAGWQPTSFASDKEFLAYPRSTTPSCLLLDVALPDLNGLDVQAMLADQGGMPIIFMTGYGDVSTTVRAMKAGAVEFLVKPFCDDVLLRAIPRALEISETELRDQALLEGLRDRYALLSPRERQVLSRIVSGERNKQVAIELGITENTVKVHRYNVMHKMQADLFVDLVNMASRLRIIPRCN